MRNPEKTEFGRWKRGDDEVGESVMDLVGGWEGALAASKKIIET